MDYVNLGTSGLRVSRICLGMASYGSDPRQPWTLGETDAELIVRHAIERGITFFDTGDTYTGGQSEVLTGRMLQRLFATREEYVVATKVGRPSTPGTNGYGLSAKHVLASIDASLQRLGLDYVDLYQIHRWDPATDVAETMQALHDIVRAGKARYLGACNMRAWQFAKAQASAPTPFVSMQSYYNLIYREEERELIPQCIDQGVGIIPWSPLARGILAGNTSHSGEPLTQRAQTDSYTRLMYAPSLDRAVVDRVGEIASERGCSRAQVALSWLMDRPGVTAPVFGATKLEHINDAVSAIGLALTQEEATRLEELYVPHSVVDV